MTYLFSTLVAFFGLITGSFLNVVILRGPAQWGLVENEKKLNLAFPASHCPKCETPIKPHHLIPVLGYILLRGRCDSCNVKISIQYPIIEALTMAAALYIFSIYSISIPAIFLFTIFCILLCLAVIDFKTTFLPDALTLPLIGICLIANWLEIFTNFQSSLIGAGIGFLTFWIIGELYYRLKGVDGLGLGDAKLLAGLGAWLGWSSLPFIVLFSSLIGLGFVLVITIANKTSLSSTNIIPFGPALIIGACVVYLLKLHELLPI